jgi:hypothetical protein
MAQDAIRIRIGASLDTASIERAFGTAEKRAQKAEAKIRRDQRASKSAQEREARDLARAEESLNRQRSRALYQIYLQEQREFAKKEREKQRELARTTKAAEREARRQQQAQARIGGDFARRTSHRATRFLAPNMPLGSIARRTALDLSRGAGIDFNMGSLLGRSIEQEQMGVKLSTKAFREGAPGAAGIRQDPTKLVQQSRKAAFNTGTSTDDLLRATFAFTSQSGDLEAAMKGQERLAKLAKSQQADLEGTFFAAGKINNALEQQPEFMHDAEKRAAEVEKIMRLLVAQTKVGSVEFEKMGAQIPKIAGIAGLFEGGTDQSLGQLAAVLQVAEKGQAKNAATAATQAQALALGFQSARASKKLEKSLGIQTTNKEGRTRELKTLITEIVVGASKKQQEKGVAASTTITSLMSNKREFLPLLDFLQIFQNAGGGAKGLAALDQTFETFAKSISEDQATGDFNAAMNTAGSRTAQFNAKLEETGDKLREKLLPAFEKLAPTLIDLVETLSKVTTWVAENPKKAIAFGISASIARAGIESAFRTGIEGAILGQRGERAGRVGRVAGALGSAGLIAAIATAVFTAGTMIIDYIAGKENEEARKRISNDTGTVNSQESVRAMIERGDIEGAKKKQEGLIAQKNKNIEEQKAAMDVGFWESIVRGASTLTDDGADAVKLRDASDQRVLEQQQRELSESKALLRSINNALSSGITIKSMPNSPAEGGDIPGREPQ